MSLLLWLFLSLCSLITFLEVRFVFLFLLWQKFTLAGETSAVMCFVGFDLIPRPSESVLSVLKMDKRISSVIKLQWQVFARNNFLPKDQTQNYFAQKSTISSSVSGSRFSSYIRRKSP